MNRLYRIGYNFEMRVKKHLEKKGWLIFRQGKSKFPDLICIKPFKNLMGNISINMPQVMLVECKVGKYISEKERDMFHSFKKKGLTNLRIYYRDNRKLKYYEM